MVGQDTALRLNAPARLLSWGRLDRLGWWGGRGWSAEPGLTWLGWAGSAVEVPRLTEVLHRAGEQPHIKLTRDILVQPFPDALGVPHLAEDAPIR